MVKLEMYLQESLNPDGRVMLAWRIQRVEIGASEMESGAGIHFGNVLKKSVKKLETRILFSGGTIIQNLEGDSGDSLET